MSYHYFRSTVAPIVPTRDVQAQVSLIEVSNAMFSYTDVTYGAPFVYPNLCNVFLHI